MQEPVPTITVQEATGQQPISLSSEAAPDPEQTDDNAFGFDIDGDAILPLACLLSSAH